MIREATTLEYQETMVLAWVPLVRQIAAHEFRRLGTLTRLLVIDADDLFQSGVLGLMEALDRYDSTRSAPQTYFSRRVRGAIYDFLRSFPYIQWDGRMVQRFEESELEFLYYRSDFDRIEIHLDLKRLVSGLSWQQRCVLESLMQEVPQTAIARHLGVTAGRVSQIKQESLATLRTRVSQAGERFV